MIRMIKTANADQMLQATYASCIRATNYDSRKIMDWLLAIAASRMGKAHQELVSASRIITMSCAWTNQSKNKLPFHVESLYGLMRTVNGCLQLKKDNETYAYQGAQKPCMLDPPSSVQKQRWTRKILPVYFALSVRAVMIGSCWIVQTVHSVPECKPLWCPQYSQKA